jgi:hypothetical protein
MSENRFNQIRRYIPFLWARKPTENDPWWQFSAAVEAFNENRQNSVLASFLKTMDESMSAFRPRTTRFGDLPHLSFILRKPEPLGTEFKTVACSETGMILHLEIQKGKMPMRQAEFCNTMQGTAACSMRLAKYTERKQEDEEESSGVSKNLWLGDSWFASVTTAVEAAKYGNFIGVIKTNHSLSPRKWVEEKMSGWPGGSHLVLEATVDGVDLLVIGYKYNKRKVLTFVATKGAGHTEPGKPYEARWKDENMNTLIRDVARPEIIAKYFGFSNAIDVHNQSRQFDLALEKHWITHSGWFRLVTTLFGMSVTDCWKAYKHHMDAKHRHKDMEFIHFVDILSHDMLHNTFSKVANPDSARVIDLPMALDTEVSTHCSGNQVSVLELSTLDEQTINSVFSDLTSPRRAQPNAVETIMAAHQLKMNDETHAYSADGDRRGKRVKRGECIICKGKTKFYCPACPPGPKRLKAWFCHESTHRLCFPNHIKALTQNETTG